MKDVAQFFKVLADEARLKIIWLLFNHRELCVCDLMKALDITQSKTSRHLATLRHARLVVDRKEANWAYYSICPAGNEFERTQLEALRVQMANHPGAKEVLGRLHDWMERKQRDPGCVDDCACPNAKTSKKAAPGRAARKGDLR